MGKLDVVFHVGAHKTATTHLQAIFSENARKLRTHGVRYLGPTEVREEFGSVEGAIGEERGIKALVGDANRLLVSEENMIGRCFGAKGLMRRGAFYRMGAERLTKLTSSMVSHRNHLAVAVREPSAFLTSLYSQVLFSGTYVPWKQFLGDADPMHKRWSDTILPLLDAAPWDTVTIWKYEDYHTVFPQILTSLLGEGHPEIPQKLDIRRHPGLSQAAVDACARWHGEGYTGMLGHIAREDYPVSDEHPAFQPWSRAEVRLSKRAYRDDMAILAAHPKVTVLQVPKAKG
ncbi:MAG: hypothetical protein ACPGRD_03410 [Planktomarina sp.]